ncbi:hypothetical protein, partial [Methylobacter sp.]|uniref:hypothetical protein n=1 Tax=Methylobacter sp. TaxID=2051955 RepID=UPI0025D42177
APEGEILSFAPPKESIQRKGGPLPLKSCAPHFHRGLPEGPSLALWQRAASMQRPCGQFPAESSGARRGKRDPIRAATSSYCSIDRI